MKPINTDNFTLYAIINKATGQIVDTAETRALARKRRLIGQERIARLKLDKFIR